jgi:hypothetical protein
MSNQDPISASNATATAAAAAASAVLAPTAAPHSPPHSHDSSSSSPFAELAVTEPASFKFVDVVAHLAEVCSDIRVGQESISKCEAKIDAIETDLSGIRTRLSALGKGSENDAERDEMHAAIARLDANIARLSSKEALLLQIQVALQSQKDTLLRLFKNAEPFALPGTGVYSAFVSIYCAFCWSAHPGE